MPFISFAFVKNMLKAIKGTQIYDIIDFNLDNPCFFCNKKVVLYGAGQVGYDYYRQLMLMKNIQIVDWIDKNFFKYHYIEREVNSIENLEHIEYDIILIAVQNEKLADQIINELASKGIERNRLHWIKPISLIQLKAPLERDS